jgi:hypothetical protein
MTAQQKHVRALAQAVAAAQAKLWQAEALAAALTNVTQAITDLAKGGPTTCTFTVHHQPTRSLSHVILPPGNEAMLQTWLEGYRRKLRRKRVRG